MTGTGFASPAVHYVSIGDRRMAFREFGAGEAAVMVHGLGGMATNWTDLMHALPLHSVAVDLPGFGYSDPLPSGVSIDALGEALAAAVDQVFPQQRVHLFGNSLGGLVVLSLAAARPDLVRSVTLISPAMPEYLPRRTNYQVPVVAVPLLGPKLFNKWRRFSAEQRMWGTVRVVYGKPERIHPVRFAEMVAETERRDAIPHGSVVYVAAVRAMLRSFITFGDRRWWRRLSRLQAPVLVIHGRRDILVNSAAAHRVARALPGASVALIMDAAHAAQMECPLEVARLWNVAVAG